MQSPRRLRRGVHQHARTLARARARRAPQVREPAGHDVATLAIKRLQGLKIKDRSVHLDVTPSTLYITDVKSADPLREIAIDNVSFVCQQDENQSIISVFENSIRLRLITSHVFKITHQPFLIPMAIQTAFQQSNNPAEGSGSQQKMNFKEALKHSFKEEHGVEPGKVLRTNDHCSYYGRSPVSETQGAEIVEEALRRIMSTKPIVKSCVVKICQRIIIITAGQSSVRIQMKDITAVQLSSSGILGIIEHQRRLDQMLCHAIGMPPTKPNDVSVRSLIVEAQKALVAEALKKQQAFVAVDGEAPSLAVPFEELETEELIGNYEASYLGSESVAGPGGEGLADKALQDCLAKKNTYNGIFIQISTEGIYVIDALTYEREEYVNQHPLAV